MSRIFAAAAALTLILTSTGAFAEMAKVGETSKGNAFVDSKGMTLYTFDKDSGGKSACNGPCATNWPPLYTFVKDTKAGDANGDGFLNGAWHIAKP
jgi:predicted lipoprotein with Yx(FWY)xxD motif